MNNNKNLKASRTLAPRDRFIYRSEVGTFVAWKGNAVGFRDGVYRTAVVLDTNDNLVRWSLNMAGSVGLV